MLFFSFPFILFLAHSINPDPSGLGTHKGLGLPPCGFYTLFHKPCPSCGMTSSFSLIMHGQFLEAIKIQPAAVFLFLSALFVWMTIPYHYAKRKKFVDLLELPYLLPILIANLAIIVLVWLFRLLF
ncbi:MAG: DUF2752 domain-containing protein [Acidobacteria bacterium]|nr:DUF2752 domain-containing protein [Acidobacteriota bacterium]